MAIEYGEAFVALGAVNFQAVVRFYSAVLGREPDEKIRDSYVAFHLPGLKLGIFKPRTGNEADFENPPGTHSGLNVVLCVKSIEAAAAELRRLGGRASNAVMETSHGREIDGYEPNGNRLILVERVAAPERM